MKCINALYNHDNTVCEVSVTDKFLFSGSYSLVNVWSVDNFQLLTTLTGFNHWVYSMLIYDNHLICGSHNMIKVRIHSHLHSSDKGLGRR
jgi:hypothetical protein